MAPEPIRLPETARSPALGSASRLRALMEKTGQSPRIAPVRVTKGAQGQGRHRVGTHISLGRHRMGTIP